MDELLMLHTMVRDDREVDGILPMNGTDYFAQVNYDGFEAGGDNRRYRCQTMAIQQFTRTLKNSETRTELYVGVEAGEPNQTEVWCSGYPVSPSSWATVAVNDFGDGHNEHIDAAAVFKDRLCMTTANDYGTQVWCTTGATVSTGSALLHWFKVNQDGFDGDHNDNGYCATVFATNSTEYLVVGTLNSNTGCEVWWTTGATIATDSDVYSWEQINHDGFGTSSNICVMDLAAFNGNLYAGTYNMFWGSATSSTQWNAGRIFRFVPTEADPQAWELVWDGAVDQDDEGETIYALAARCFGELNNELYVGLFHDDDAGPDLYKSSTGASGSWVTAGTIESGYVTDVIDLINFCDTNDDPPEHYLYATTGRGSGKFVCRSSNGQNWEKRSDDGFGDSTNTSLFCFGTFAERHEFNALYVGTWKSEGSGRTGTEIWQTPIGDCTYITLDSFEATARDDGSILLRWETGTELGTAGFHLYRSVSADFESFEKVTTKLIDATGTLEAGGEYAVLDRSASPGVLYYYFLVEIDVNGKMSAYGPVQARAKIPQPVSFEMYSAIIQMDTFGV